VKVVIGVTWPLTFPSWVIVNGISAQAKMTRIDALNFEETIFNKMNEEEQEY